MTKYEQIDTMREEPGYSVEELCAALEVSRSGYYSWKEREPSRRDQENQRVVEELREIHADRHLKAYGSPRMTRELQDREFSVSENRVARLMRNEGIKACSKRPFRPRTTVQDPLAVNRIAPNHLAAIEEVTAPGQVLVGDITYVQTKEGWLYLAAVMDLFSRCVLGWKIGENMETPLVSEALEKASRSGITFDGGYFHSDRGCQYTSIGYLGLVDSLGLTSSMSATGYCYDNAACESFFATLKAESFPDGRVFETKLEAKRRIFDYIETFYNSRRKHSSLDYHSPIEYLKKHLQNPNLTLS